MQCEHVLTVCINLLYTCVGDDINTDIVLVCAHAVVP